MLGSTKWFNDQKGFGFITGDDGGQYFVHHSEIQGPAKGRKTLVENQKVEFTPTTSEKGLKATKVFPK